MRPRPAIEVLTLQARSVRALQAQAALQARRLVNEGPGERVLIVYSPSTGLGTGPEHANIYREQPLKEPR